MALIEWKDRYSVGIPDVDYEHRQIINLINEMHERMTTRPEKLDAGDALGEIFRAISAHFALEERFMEDHRYDQFSEHKSSHEQLLDEIRSIMDGYEANPAEASKMLSRQLDRWFTEHCKTYDARLHQMLGNHDHY